MKRALDEADWQEYKSSGYPGHVYERSDVLMESDTDMVTQNRDTTTQEESLDQMTEVEQEGHAKDIVHGDGDGDGYENEECRDKLG